jgi:hypothetical protein
MPHSAKKCDSCRRKIASKELWFVLRIELFADPTPPDITKEDLHKDHKEEMKKIIKEMGKTNPDEANDEIHERYQFVVCKDCRKKLHRRLKFPFLTVD